MEHRPRLWRVLKNRRFRSLSRPFCQSCITTSMEKNVIQVLNDHLAQLHQRIAATQQDIAATKRAIESFNGSAVASSRDAAAGYVARSGQSCISAPGLYGIADL